MSDGPIVSITHDAIIYRASALGMCDRALVAGRLGFAQQPPPKTLWRAFQRGKALEKPILNTLVTQERWVPEPDSAQREVDIHVGTLDTGKRLIVRGHVDILATPPGGRHFMPVDAKAFGTSYHDKFLSEGLDGFPQYAWQLSAYAVGFGTTSAALAIYWIDGDSLTVAIEEVPFTYDDIANRVYAIESLADNDSVPTDVKCAGVWGCPFRYLHDVAPDHPAIPDELVSLVARYDSIGDKIKAWQTIRKTLSEIISDKLPYDANTRTFTGPGFTVTVQSNARRLDITKVKQLFREAEMDIDPYYTPGEGVHIVVKERG